MRDVAAVPAGDPANAVVAVVVLPLVAGIVVGVLLILRIRGAGGRGVGSSAQLAGALILIGTTGFAIAAVKDVLFASLTGDHLTDAAVLALALVAISMTILGLSVLAKAEVVAKRDVTGDRETRIARALGRPPEPADIRAALKWRHLDEPWRAWLRRSGAGVDLVNRWNEASEHVALLGEAAYREQLVQTLSRVAPRDCAAAGFGCTRRSDRSCREPEICSQDPPADSGGAVRREGPRPGGCDHYYGWRGDDPLHVHFSAGDRHRAVEWAGRMWIDGDPIAEDHTFAGGADWLDDRFLVASVQEYDGTVSSVVVHDADRRSTVILTPTAGERWTNPTVVRDGAVLLVHPDRTGGRPDRTLPIEPNPFGT